MTDYTPLSRFRKLLSRLSAYSKNAGEELQLRGFKPGGTTGQVPVKTGSGNFLWTWTTLGLGNISGLVSALNGKSNVGHTHTIAQVSGLQAALDGKAGLTTKTITPAGQTGAKTINTAAGTVNFAAAATTLVVTNSLVTANSIVLCVLRTQDASAVLDSVVPSAGSFVIRMSVAPAAETSVGFFVI